MSAWSAQQAQWLSALGYRVLVRREADWTGAAPVVQRGQAAQEPAQRQPAQRHPPYQDPAHVRPAAPRPERSGPPPDASINAAPAPAVPPVQRADASAKLVALGAARRQRAFTDPRYADLLGNLLRVAGLEGDPGRERLRELDVDLPTLQRDPAAKRALWPRLRSLRRASRQ